jgi:malonyl CoA-acyl carrier protein transacylase
VISFVHQNYDHQPSNCSFVLILNLNFDQLLNYSITQLLNYSITQLSNMTDKLDQLSPLQRAVYALKETRGRLDALQQQQNEPIAIIGMGCRFPGGANDPESFWELLEQGIDAVSEVPLQRWDVEQFYDSQPDIPGKMQARAGGFLNIGLDLFDADFFRLAPREVVNMDPQQRLLLEVSWEALERSGQASQKLMGSQTGVFIGITTSDYAQRAMLADTTDIDIYTATGNSLNVAAGRLSYSLGLMGPSMAIDTACSSSLVAVHQACQSLRAGECRMALAGGVNVMLSPQVALAISKLRALAPDGRCKTFDAEANGYGRAEGCGIVVLKRLSDAISAKDNILAVIRGSAVNQDGRSSGLTVPNGLAQQAVVRSALEKAQVDSKQISYVETHGTGTPLGDPIELKALATVLGKRDSAQPPLMVGSVKTNVGHLEAAAGIASLIKVVLAMQHQAIPPHLHLKKLNPHIANEQLPLTIPTEITPWRTENPQAKRLAGISSFGFSGTNAHMILEEAPNKEHIASEVERPLHLLAISAKSEAALATLAGKFAHYLQTHPSVSLADVCFTANTGRTHFEHRLALVAESSEQLGQELAEISTGKSPRVLPHNSTNNCKPEVVFLFTGQGSQYIGMGKHLYETQPIFRQTLEYCDQLLSPYFSQSLLSVLYPDPETSSPLNETAYTQPALFALEYSLAQVWQSWGIEPTVVIGHSVGEYVAACLAGVFSLEDGIKLIAQRAKLMQSLPRNGEMAAIFTSEAHVAEVIAPYSQQLSIAAINGPENIVISGQQEAVQSVLKIFADKEVNFRSLAVSHAFHSPLMEPILDQFEQIAQEVKYSAPQLPLVSNLTGQLVTAQEITTAKYWRRHLREAVRFSDSIQFLDEQGYQLFLEIGPHSVLSGMGRRCVSSQTGIWLASLKKGENDWQKLLQNLGILYQLGVDINWDGLEQNYKRYRLSLPTYPFQRQRYWKEKLMLNTIEQDKISENLPQLLPVQQLTLSPQSLKSEKAIVEPIVPSRLLKKDLLLAQAEDRQIMLEDYLQKILAQSLQIPISQLNKHHLVASLLDSLITVELKKQIETDLHISVPMLKFYEELSIEQFAAFISEQLNSVSLLEQLNSASLNLHSFLEDVELEDVEEDTLVKLLNEIEILSEIEVEKMLAEKYIMLSRL